MTIPLYNLTDTWIADASDGLNLTVNTAGHTGNIATLAMGTVTANVKGLNITGTWNNAGVTFDAPLFMNITRTAYNALSKLVDLQVDSSITVFSVDNGGQVLAFSSVQTLNGSFMAPNTSTGAGFGFTGGLANLSWDAAGIIAQRATTTAQTLRVYNTFTDASNYERGVFDWQFTSNVFRIGTEKAGTGSTRNILFQIGGTNKLDYGVTTAAYWTTPDDFKARLLQTQGFTVATLPAAGAAGRMAYVTDALAPSFLASVVGGGAIITPVFDNGTNWVGA